MAQMASAYPMTAKEMQKDCEFVVPPVTAQVIAFAVAAPFDSMR
jgi:hypothetical protein